MSWIAQGFRLVPPSLLGLLRPIPASFLCLVKQNESLNSLKNSKWGKNKLHKSFEKHKPCSTLCLGNDLSWIPISFQKVQSSPSKTSSQPPCQLPASTPQQPTQQQKQLQQPRGLNPSVRKVAHSLLPFLPCFSSPAARVCSSARKGTCAQSWSDTIITAR